MKTPRRATLSPKGAREEVLVSTFRNVENRERRSPIDATVIDRRYNRKSRTKGKTPMVKVKRSKSRVTRSLVPKGATLQTEQGAAEPDVPMNGLEFPGDPGTGSPNGKEETPLERLVTLAREAIPVLPYQDRWIRDDSQLKVAVWSRQSGKSFAAALRAVLKCMGTHTQYIILSKGERQSRMFMEKVKEFCVTFKRLRALPKFTEFETDDKTMEVYFPCTRSRITGLPANPDTARGYSGNIVLDEFAFHSDAHKIYAACFPIITRGYSIEVISTPNGTTGKFYEIAKSAGLVGGQDQGGGGQDQGARIKDSGAKSQILNPESSLWVGGQDQGARIKDSGPKPPILNPESSL
jgi:hypothetical protein